MYANLVKEYRGAAFAAAAIAVAVLVACATAQAPLGSSPELAGVRVETGADATKVVLLGVDGVHPTAVQEQGPARIVVDLTATVAMSAEGATPVWDGTLEEVTVTTQAPNGAEPRTQVVIGLAADALWEMQTSDDGLVVRVARTAGMTDPEAIGATSEAPADPWAADATAEAPAAAAKRASVLRGVGVSSAGAGLVLDLQADGTIEGMKSFVLGAPAPL